MSTKIATWAPAAEIIAVDSSPQAIASARQYAQSEHVSNVNYIVSDILAYLSAQADSTFDAAFFLEVSFFMPEFKRVIAEIKRVLKKDGLVFASFRSQYFDALYSMKQNDWESAQTILDSRTGSLWGSKIQFTWQTSGEVSDLLKGHEFKLLDLVGIGVMSGIKGDPHEYIARPSTLPKENQSVLNTLETSNAKIVPDAGRYMLAIAQK
jgi:ubiquinone/menaquinone biosynthesis C-methylase UbiE